MRESSGSEGKKSFLNQPLIRGAQSLRSSWICPSGRNFLCGTKGERKRNRLEGGTTANHNLSGKGLGFSNA